MGNETREFLAAVAGPGLYAGHWEHEEGEDAFLAARDELRSLGMAEGRIVAFLAALYDAGRAEAFEKYPDHRDADEN